MGGGNKVQIKIHGAEKHTSTQALSRLTVLSAKWTGLHGNGEEEGEEKGEEGETPVADK